MTLTIIADDLTGACDSGAVFCGHGRVTVFAAGHARGDPERELIAVDTDSRALPAGNAARRITGLCSRLGDRLGRGLTFKKIDSTLRGPIGAEVDALLSHGNLSGALLCPAFPAQERTVRDGVLRVAGVPAHLSPVGRDPDYPGPTADIAEILATQTPRPVRRLPLETVRGAPAELARVLGQTSGAITVADAETDGDLEALAAAALTHTHLLLAGSAGLAQAIRIGLGYPPAPTSLPAGRAWLIVAGSRHPATRSQVERLEADGALTIRTGDEAGDVSALDVGAMVEALNAGRPAVIASRVLQHDGPNARALVAERLARAAAATLSAVTPALVCVTGGETAHALMLSLGAGHLELTACPASGLASGELVAEAAGAQRRLPLLTKAGGFGPPDLFASLLGAGERMAGASERAASGLPSPAGARP